MERFQFTDEYLMFYEEFVTAPSFIDPRIRKTGRREPSGLSKRAREAIAVFNNILRNKKLEAAKWLMRKMGVNDFINAFRPPLKKKEIIKELLLWTALPAGLGAILATLGIPLIMTFVIKGGAWFAFVEASQRLAKEKESELLGEPILEP